MPAPLEAGALPQRAACVDRTHVERQAVVTLRRRNVAVPAQAEGCGWGVRNLRLTLTRLMRLTKSMQRSEATTSQLGTCRGHLVRTYVRSLYTCRWKWQARHHGNRQTCTCRLQSRRATFCGKAPATAPADKATGAADRGTATRHGGSAPSASALALRSPASSQSPTAYQSAVRFGAVRYNSVRPCCCATERTTNQASAGRHEPGPVVNSGARCPAQRLNASGRREARFLSGSGGAATHVLAARHEYGALGIMPRRGTSASAEDVHSGRTHGAPSVPGRRVWVSTLSVPTVRLSWHGGQPQTGPPSDALSAA